MSARGRKVSTPENSPSPLVLPGPYAPISPLTASGKREFDRLVNLLRRRGVLDRVDVGHITEAARVKEFIDAECAHGASMDTKEYARLANLRRGLLRELGLTLQPSRAMYRVSGGLGTDSQSRWAHALAGDGE
jgi:hypothetical protein